MPNAGYLNLTIAIALLVLAAILFLSSRVGGGILQSEKVFDAELHNSLYYIDRAKWQWVAEKHKPEQVLPTLADLAPYLGDWTNRIAQLVSLGTKYEITPFSEEEPQSDIATLTRDLRFQSGIQRFYPAGTRYCVHTGWAFPESRGESGFRAFYMDMANRRLLGAVLTMLALVNLLMFAIKKIWKSAHVNSDHART